MYLVYTEKRPEKMKGEDSKFDFGMNNKDNNDGWFINQHMIWVKIPSHISEFLYF